MIDIQKFPNTATLEYRAISKIISPSDKPNMIVSWITNQVDSDLIILTLTVQELSRTWFTALVIETYQKVN